MKTIKLKPKKIGLFTKTLQDEIDNLQESAEIHFEKGEYKLSTVFLKSNVTFIFEEGVTILGADSFYDYAPEERYDYTLYQDSSHSNFHCSLFVAENCDNISFIGKAVIDMRSVWDEDGVRGEAIKHRGAKCITLKECKNVAIKGVTILNATDLAIYFTSCENVEISDVKMRVYIDGISPDNSKNVIIRNCDVETGDDGIVLKSSYNLNRLDYCKDIKVYDCKIKSRCNAIKFGTESNGGFENVVIENIEIRQTRITGISIESVDGAKIKNIKIKNVDMKNVNAPLFIHLGKRLRGPIGSKIGSISNIVIENIRAVGPYEPYEIIEWNYFSYKKHDVYQNPKIFGSGEGIKVEEQEKAWQFTSNICGLKGNNLKDIRLNNVYFELEGGITDYEQEVPEEAQDYPEIYVYGKVLPAKGIYFRHIDGLKLSNVIVNTYKSDSRKDFVFDDVNLI